ncbi:MAG: hypothetical protein Q7S92_03565 [Candidatus Diapherotrites archaeon]|nr:hypothetical protein [Candidatus Diapherotrites archaeon]
MKIKILKPSYFFSTIFKGIKSILKQPKYLAISILSSLILLTLIIFVEINSVPGKNLEAYIGQLTSLQSAYTVFLVLGTGLLVSMQAHIYNLNKEISVKNSTGTALAGLSAIASAIFASATCASCVAAFFGILGANGVFFLIDHRWEFVILGTLIILFSLFKASERILGLCPECQIKVA